MARYDFKRLDSGEVFELCLSWSALDAARAADGSYELEIDGQRVSCVQDYSERVAYVPPTTGWPIYCDGTGVHPQQIPHFKKFLKERGVPTEYTPGGECVLRNRGHRKKVLAALGMIDRNGGYGD